MRNSIVDKTATGQKIRGRMDEVGLGVRGINVFFNFACTLTIYNWRKGIKMPTLEHLAVLAVILGVPMSEIVVADTSAYSVRAKGLLYSCENGSIGATRNLLVPRGERMIIPNVNVIATGARINQLMLDAGMTIQDMQKVFGFNTPQAIYKWVKGGALPTIGHLAILAATLGVSMDEIVIVGVTVLSMPDGKILSSREDIQITLAAMIELLRAEKVEITARR